jgi:GT2 family glycosyltransferase/glycosyltransferase involved in cell wall biosynthesis/Tfp pilus assembly protein PilF
MIMPSNQKPLFSCLPSGAGLSPRSLRICVASCEFVGPVRNGGIGTAYTAMAYALAAAGHKVTLFYTQGRRCESATIAHWVAFYKERGLPFVARPSSADLRIDAPPHAVRSYETYLWLKDHPFDLVHFPEWGGDAYYSLLAKHQGLAFDRTLFCIGTHSPTEWLKEANSEHYSNPVDLELAFMERRSIALADIVVSPCNYMLQWMSDRGFELPPRAYVQQNLLPTNVRGPHEPSQPHERQSISELVFFGRLETRKGIELFCDAIDRIVVLAQLKNLSMTFLGKPATVNGTDSRVYIRQRAIKWNVPWNIVSDQDQPGAMRYLRQPGRLAVIPSLIENSPYTVLECLGGGMPFLASRVGGIPELVALEDIDHATFLPTPAALAELLSRTIDSGARPWKPALDATANQAAWIAWHDGLASEINSVPAVCAISAPQPLVSVCVSHFNRPHFLKQAIASLEAQIYGNFEVIIVDDGSTTPEAIRYLQELEPKLALRNWRLIRQENRYLSAARNTGARHAKGEYLLFMDDDNFANPQELSTFVQVALRTEADIVTCCMNYFQGQEPPQKQPKTLTRWVPLGAAASAGYFRNCFGDANCLVKRSTFDQLGGFTEIHGVTHEDWEFLANAVLKGCHLEMIPEALFHYRYTPNSMIRSTSQYRNHLRHIRPYLDLVPPAMHQILLMAQGAWIAETRNPRSHANLGLNWRVKFEAARALSKLGHTQAVKDLLLDALKAAEATEHAPVILEALVAVGGELRTVDPKCGRNTLELAVSLAQKLSCSSVAEVAKGLLGEMGKTRSHSTRDISVAPPVPTRQPAVAAANKPVSIIIPTFNNLELTRSCLESIAKNTPADNYEVIVIDNGSTDGTREFLAVEQSSGRITATLNESNYGFARACNQGAACAKGKHLAFLNNDTEVHPGWLEPLLNMVENDSRVGAVGSKLLFPDGTIQHAGVVLVDDRRLNDPLLARHAYHKAAPELPEANRPMVYQALTAACLLVPRALFNTLGGFDEQFWNGYEDVDLCFRLAEAGRLAVYQPASVVTHHESQSGPERFRKAPQNIARLHQKWLGRIRPDFIAGTDGEMTKTESVRIREYSAAGGKTITTPRCVASIIIPVLNQLLHTRQCLESVVAHTQVSHEIIIVDNGSTDGTGAFLEAWRANHSNCKVIRNSSNRGFAAANNRAFGIAGGEHLVLLNNDTVVTDRWLEGMLRVLREHPETGIVGPMSNNVSGPQYAGKVEYRDLAGLPDFAAHWSQTHQGQSIEIPRAVGFCILLRRALLDRIGGLDESFGSGNFEDDDFCIRARIAGFRVRLAKDVFIHHTGSQTFKSARINYREAMLRNWEIFRTKWKMPAEITLENGYPVPNQLPTGVCLKVEIPPLGVTHESDGNGSWREKARCKSSVLLLRPVAAVAGVGNLEAARALFEQKEWASAWKAAMEALVSRPCHPEAYLLLAEVALAAGDGQTARQCAQQARELAPDWKAPKQFLQKPLKGNSQPDWLEMPDWVRQRVSGHAQQSLRVTVCVIARNEEKFLAQCLQSIKEIAYQIVVVDTGSTDRTIEIAKSFGAEVYSFDWCDDFSAARNAALEHARGDWVLVLDADEELPPDQHARLRADLKNRKLIALRLPLVNSGQEAEGRSCVPRLFRNAPGIYYSGRIHEQVFPSLIALGKKWGLGTGLGTAQLRHHGYSKENVRDRNKVERNLKLLRQAVEESPDDANLEMNFGLELVRFGDLEGGLLHYRQAFDLMSKTPPADLAPELREALLTQFTSHLYKVRSYGEIVSVLTSALAKAGGLTASLHFALGLAYFELGRYPEAAEQMRQCLAKRRQSNLTPINTDILTAAPYHCLAMTLAKTGDSQGAEKSFQSGMTEKGRGEELRLDYAKFLVDQNRPVDALHLLHEVVAQNASCVAAWRLGGQIALSRADFLEFACDWTAEAIKLLPENKEILSQCAEALLLSRQTAQARGLWQTLWDQDHQHRSQAALLICDIIEDTPGKESTAPEPEFGPTSHAFIEWYRRCLAMRSQAVVSCLNQRIEVLRSVLPAAAAMLESAITEADEQPATTPEPCLA